MEIVNEKPTRWDKDTKAKGDGRGSMFVRLPNIEKKDSSTFYVKGFQKHNLPVQEKGQKSWGEKCSAHPNRRKY